MSTTHAWTPEMSQRLHEQYERLVASEIVSFSADLTIGSLLLGVFNANINEFYRRGLRFSWTRFEAAVLNSSYQGFTATGRRDVMNEYMDWYRRFFNQ